jgi:tetratricopeptide (TPR) repeat protein
MDYSMRAATKFVILIVLLLALVAVVSFQRRSEQISMLAEEGRHREAIALLQRRLVDHPHDADQLAAMARSYAALGEYGQAIDLYGSYLMSRPNDLLALQRQADLLLESGMFDRYLDALARLVEARPSTEQIGRLVALYRLHGRPSDELATLRKYAGRGLLPTDQLERLGALLLAEGNWREARQWLAIEERKSPLESSTGRLLLLEALIQNDEADQAYRYAERWMTAWRNPFLSGKLMLRMARAGLDGPASELALKWEGLMPDTTFEMAGLFVSQGHGELARIMLARWADQTENPTEEQLRAFVSTSAMLDTAPLVIAKFLQLVRDSTEPARLAQLADDMANAFGAPALSAIRPLLSSDILLTRPLFAARLSLSEGNYEMARWFLDRCDPNELTPEERPKWFALLQRVDTQADAVDRLLSLWEAGRLPADLAPQLADQALAVGRIGAHDAIWRSLER